ncbi:membrane dipeptidase [Cecembia sp.]|uniref:dipeptidase n=1 Tax=Cecembia sp. TaxID=1898110 RepID=UPI0025C1C50B|nr:membrane dipeptidase [Cecembia sp.]
MQVPIIDTHCDILSYLAKVPGAKPDSAEEIACALPLLRHGNVKMQVCAIYTDVKSGSMELATKQAFKYREMLMTHPQEVIQADADFLDYLYLNSKIGMVAAIENAAGLAEEKVPIEDAFAQLDQLIKLTGRIAYISLTHHTENRFGGGNYTTGIGLKKDGKLLLDYISGKKIAIDLSHTSDLLAEGILSHIDAQKLDIPVMASHSNFRTVWEHKRNLNHEFAQEVIRRKGLIGVNFLRAFLDDQNPERIYEHILHGFEIGAEEQMCFGADFFYTKDFPDKSRHPFYFPIVEDASKYPGILEKLAENLSQSQLEKLAYKNCQRFFSGLWRK